MPEENVPNLDDPQAAPDNDQPADGGANTEPTLSQVMESISTLSESLSALSGKVDGFEERMIATPNADDNQIDDSEDHPPVTEDSEPSNWQELNKTIQQTAIEKAQEVLDREKEAQKTAREEGEKQQSEINKAFDAMESSLEKDGMLPPVVDANNENDPGRVARRELYSYAQSTGTTDLVAAGKLLDTLHKNGLTFDRTVGNFIKVERSFPGHNAPVGSGNSSAGVSDSGPSYKDIHNTPMDVLVNRAGL